jgi:threonine synthase
MSHFVLECVSCAVQSQPDLTTLQCAKCAAPVAVRYIDWNPASPGVQPPRWDAPPIPLPIANADSYVSLGEGNTPVIETPTIGRYLGLDALFAKLEFMNPSGSFKDRGTAVMLSVVQEMGAPEIVEDSSGNAGASVSAYSARSGIKAHIFAPASAPAAKIGQIRVYGALPHPIEGTRDQTTEAAETYYRERGLVYASHNRSPYFIEGTKTFAYEVYRRFEGTMPRHIVMPVGNGSLYIGAWKGFQELRAAGHGFDIPRLHCVQAEAVQPIVAAFEGRDWSPLAGVTTAAGGIAVGKPPHLGEIVSIIQKSGGSAVAVPDSAIIEWQKRLALSEGIFGEPTSAAAYAGLQQLAAMGVIEPGESVLVPVTGFGLKDALPV